MSQSPSPPDPFARIARLACALLDAPGALLFAFDGQGGTRVLGAHGVAPEQAPTPPGLVPALSLPLLDGSDAGPSGSLVVLCPAPRSWSAGQRAAAEELAGLAGAELAWRRQDESSRAAHDENHELLQRERAARAQAEAAERRAAFIAEVGSVLDDSLDYVTAFKKLVRLTIPVLADYCVIDEMEPDGGTRRIARAHVDAEKEKILWDNVRHPPEADPEHHPLMGVVRRGNSVLVGECTDEVFDTIAHDADHRYKISTVLGLKSFIIVPLLARGRVLGIITLAFSDSGRRYGPAELSLAEEMARRAALAIDNARLYGLAQQAIRAREGVLGVVSHDLRNPLASIILNTTMMLELAPAGTLEPWISEGLRQTLSLVDQSNRLIENLLDVSRIANGGMALLRARQDLRDLVTEGLRMLRPLADERGVALQAELADAPVFVLADADRLQQVISNIVGNAIKFTPPGGSVRVGATVDEARGEGRVVVADTGVGIPADLLREVFDPFRQVGEADRRGLGLGLPIARGIVEAHGGSMWAESEPGQGSTFTFTLPRSA